ncbi:MAG: 2-oxo acid dehydrogenase subunit E2 [Planctomycetota bacterium]
MALEFKLPDIGEGIAEGEIVQWLVAEGDVVEEHQPVVEVMTDKATVEVPAPQAGTITELRVAEGDIVPVGEVLFVLDGAGGAKFQKQGGKPGAEKGGEKKGKQAANGAGKRSEPAPEPVAASTSLPEQPSPAENGGGGGRVIDFKLPDIGEGIAEGEIVQWLVEEGAVVEEHQPIVEVMTDKATVEVPAPASGTITKQLRAAGDVVPIGEVIFQLATEGAVSERVEQAAAAQPEPVAASASEQATRGGKGSRTQANGKARAVPSARRVARELDIDLTEVDGTGPNGVIRRADVEAFSKSGGGAAAPTRDRGEQRAAPERRTGPAVSIPKGERETRVPFRGVRRKIAEAMSRSMFTATHFTVVEELDVTELVALRAKAKAIGAKQDVKITYMPFIMKAAAISLARYPELNSQLDESTNEIVTFGYVNLGIATDTKNGLIVPVIDDVQDKGLLQLGRELGELAERTRAGKIKPEELSGGTFTITNAGNIGGTLATPIINFPEVAILGVHRLMKRPGIVETPDGDEIAVRQYMNLSISVDHRLVDGASAARFLVSMKELLEEPGLLSL